MKPLAAHCQHCRSDELQDDGYFYFCFKCWLHTPKAIAEQTPPPDWIPPGPWPRHGE